MPSVPCSRIVPSIMCDTRREAGRAGEMYFSIYHGGWIWPAENRAVPKGTEPVVWRDWCPFCGGPLPTVASAERAIWEDSDDQC